MNTYARINRKVTPQSEPIAGTVKNDAGGFSFPVDKWVRLSRFLILGSEKGSYYVGERKLTLDNAACVDECAKTDFTRTVNTIRDISYQGRAPKNDPALFALAIASKYGDVTNVLPDVARIPTHLFHYVQYIANLRGWARSTRRSVAHWYLSKDPNQLAYQAIKYRQRDGWTHKDALAVSHPKAIGLTQDIFRWMVKGWDGEVGDAPPSDEPHMRIIWAYERAQATKDWGEIVKLITDYSLPWEALPTNWLSMPVVWEALLYEPMPLTAMIRNLGKMTSIDLIQKDSQAEAFAVKALSNVEAIKKARIHPLNVLVALKVYEQGHGERGKLEWNPSKRVMDALDGAFYSAFDCVEPTGARIMEAFDVSGSMTNPELAGMPGITPRVGAAAMAMTSIRTEPNVVCTAFSGSHGNTRAFTDSNARGDICDFEVSPIDKLTGVITKMDGMPFSSTDCALPMLYAKERKLQIDVFRIYTDAETWSGRIHPIQALDQYRRASGINAKMIVVGMVANEFTIADPKDAGTLDVVGFDTSVPAVMNDFILN